MLGVQQRLVKTGLVYLGHREYLRLIGRDTFWKFSFTESIHIEFGEGYLWNDRIDHRSRKSDECANTWW